MDGFDDCDMGRTPARLVNRSLGDMFHRPWDTKRDGKAAAGTRGTSQRNVGGDPRLKELERIMNKCAEELDCGGNGIKAFQCPNSKRCEQWWVSTVNLSAVRYITEGDLRLLKMRFEEIRPR